MDHARSMDPTPNHLRTRELERRTARRDRYRWQLAARAETEARERFDDGWTTDPWTWGQRMLESLELLVRANDQPTQARALLDLGVIAESWYAALDADPPPGG